jgi:transposase-like protein
MSDLYTKTQIAKIYKVTPRTVSNWLSRARAEMGESFPDNYEGNAIAFTDDQVETLLKYAGDADKKIAEPATKVVTPEVLDVDQVAAEFGAITHVPQPVQSLLSIQIKPASIGRAVADTTAIESETLRLQGLTNGQVHSLAEALAARFKAGVEGIVAQQDQVLAAVQARSISAGSEVV